MSTNAKDVKILWAKAAGRCSMPDCRKKLIAASGREKSGSSLIGENCHIVAEKESGPRGESSLTLEERSRYPNLILLCRNHHKTIDDDAITWSIEKLHQIKSDHEIWVEEALSESNNVDDEWYVNIINGITNSFTLSGWEVISDNMLRGILHQEFIDRVYDINAYLFKAIFPGKYPELEEKIKNLIQRARHFVDHYTSNSRTLEPDYNVHRRRKFYKEVTPNPNYHEDVKLYEKWEGTCTKLLFNLTHALNQYADQVREDVNPNYFKLHGQFVVYDQMGVLPQHEWGGSYIPNEYIEDEDTKID